MKTFSAPSCHLKAIGVRRGFRKDFALTLMGQIGILGLGVVSSVLAARLLGPRGRGELAAIILWPTCLVFLFSMGNTQSIVFHTGRGRFGISEIWTAMLVIGTALSICAMLAGIWLVPFALRHDSPQARHLSLAFLACVPLIWLSGIPTSLMLGRLETSRFNLLRMVCPAIYATGLLALFLLHRASLGDAVAFQFLGLLALDALGFGLVRRKLRPRWDWNFKACRSLLNFGWKTQLGDLASYVNQRLDQLLLTAFVPPRDLGYYVVAVTVSMSMGFFPQAAGIVTLGTGSSLAPEGAKKMIGKSFAATLLALTAGCAALWFLCPWLIPFAFGARFAPAVTACRILLPGAVALGLNQVLFNGARALDHPSLPSYAEGLGVAVTCVALGLLLPRYGFVGAAVASTLAYASSLLCSLVLFYRQLGITPTELVWSSPHVFGRRAVAGALRAWISNA